MRTIILLLTLGLVSRGLAAQQPESPEPLSGPRVLESTTGCPLITLDYEGRVNRLETWPEIEAVKFLDLSAEEREIADRALAKRARALDDFIIQNVDLLSKLGTSSAAGKKTDSLLLLAEAFRKLQPVRDAGSVHDLLAKSLPKDKAKRMDRLVRQYWNAVVGECRSGSRKEARFAILLDEGFKIFGKELEDSFARQLTNEDRQIEFYIRYLKLRPEQELRVRQIVGETYARTAGELTKQERDQMMLAVIAHLDEKQREMLAP